MKIVRNWALKRTHGTSNCETCKTQARPPFWLNHIDAKMAGQELRSLAQTGFVEQSGIGRWTYYTLKALDKFPKDEIPETDEEKILFYVKKHGLINNAECRELLDVDLQRAS